MNINTEDILYTIIVFPWSIAMVIILCSFRRVSMTRTNNKHCSNGPKKTTIGQGKFSKWGNRGGGPSGSTPSKNYRKKPRGQG